MLQLLGSWLKFGLEKVSREFAFFSRLLAPVFKSVEVVMMSVNEGEIAKMMLNNIVRVLVYGETFMEIVLPNCRKILLVDDVRIFAGNEYIWLKKQNSQVLTISINKHFRSEDAFHLFIIICMEISPCYRLFALRLVFDAYGLQKSRMMGITYWNTNVYSLCWAWWSKILVSS